MSPIFVRPVREQLEHDRLIRHLGAKFKRKFEVGLNIGDQQVAPVKLGSGTFFPDVVLTEGRRTAGLIEVETAESVNNLEAMAQWVHFARSRTPFSLYVPMAAYDVARRLCEANGARVAEIWVYRVLSDGFDLIRMYHDSVKLAAAARAAVAGRAAAKKADEAAAKKAKVAAAKAKAAAKKAQAAAKKAEAAEKKRMAKAKLKAKSAKGKKASKAKKSTSRPAKAKVKSKKKSKTKTPSKPAKAKVVTKARSRVSSLRRAAERAGKGKAPARKAPRKR